jgi:hypothetical protein
MPTGAIRLGSLLLLSCGSRKQAVHKTQGLGRYSMTWMMGVVHPLLSTRLPTNEAVMVLYDVWMDQLRQHPGLQALPHHNRQTE